MTMSPRPSHATTNCASDWKKWGWTSSRSRTNASSRPPRSSPRPRDPSVFLPPTRMHGSSPAPLRTSRREKQASCSAVDSCHPMSPGRNWPRAKTPWLFRRLKRWVLQPVPRIRCASPPVNPVRIDSLRISWAAFKTTKRPATFLRSKALLTSPCICALAP